jgi:ubiquinone/menaquinone biosynthesis C-methylase UbiE
MAGMKEQVREFWNRQSCGTENALAAKFTRDYFEQLETHRYFDQPYIHAFAQFTRYRGKRVLEVGFGPGTDFIQWLRAGAQVSGIDLTQEGLDHLRHRIEVYGLPEPESIRVADAENLPFESDSFDLGYSFGVLHHSPNTEKAISELVRVVKPGGEIKIMVYNRRCIYAMGQWVKHALLRGKPWKGLAWVMWHHMESIGTKGYTRRELKQLFAKLPVEYLRVQTEITSADVLSAAAFPPLNWCFRAAIRLAGNKYPYHPSHYGSRQDAGGSPHAPAPIQRPQQILMTGNRLGFFHCIAARKKAA